MTTLIETSTDDIPQIRRTQGDYFLRGETRSLAFRRTMLKRLYQGIKEHEQEFIEALKKDLGKSEFEAYSNELGLVYHEIKYAIAHLGKWARPIRVIPDLPLLPGSAWMQREPYGTVLIMAPWNYPMQLLFMPLVGAMAAGNTVILKPSEQAVHTALVSEKVITKYFDPHYLKVVQGGPRISEALVASDVDYIFFTGSVPVGKKIMASAANFLTPLTLELGGKSPAFVTKHANLAHAAKKIVWGKFNNAGQTCVAPDYVLVDAAIADKLVEAMHQYVREFYGDKPSESKVYGRIISPHHVTRLKGLLDQADTRNVTMDEDKTYFAPTLVYPAQWNDRVMEDEIFGPILPIITYTDLNEAIHQVQRRPKPLALYVFSEDSTEARKVVNSISFGGGAINTTILHVASQKIPFGGVGPSGMGRYHGKESFLTFSHQKSMLKQGTMLDLPMAYPNKNVGLRLLRSLMG